MSLDYTKLFGDLGKLAKYVASFETVADTTMPAAMTAIVAQFDAIVEPLANITSDFDTMRGNIDAARATLANYARKRLQDKTTVLDELHLATSGIDAVMAALITQMNLDSESVLKSTVTIGSVTDGSGNSGDATVITTRYLDGVNAPGNGYRSHPQYAGVLSELASPSETMTVVCTQDAYTDGVDAGSESYSVSGGLRLGDRLSHHAEGSGPGPTLQTLNGANLLTNGDFETFTTANTPDDWTVVSGTPGTHIFNHTSDYYRGSHCLRLLGDDVQGTIKLTQELGGLIPLQGYLIVAAIKADASIPQGDFSIKFTGTGYTAAAHEKISIAPGDLPTSWTVYSAFVVVPANLPSDFKLNIIWETTPDAGKKVLVDSVCVALPAYHGGIGIGVHAGPYTAPAVRGDSYSFAVSNNQAGKLQEFARRALGYQLPSNASPTIADSLAE